MNSNKEHWILCPACGSKTRARLLPDTVLRSFPYSAQSADVKALSTCRITK